MPPKKKVSGFIKLQINAGAATPAPPVGPALGQHGVNIMEFVKAYNAATEAPARQCHPRRDHGLRRPLVHLRHQDPAGRRADQEGRRRAKGSGEPHKTKVAKLTRDQVREIAEQKMVDLNANDIDMAMRIIAGTARSMGITTEL
jgi:large subunit ribosomal protein L11